MNTSLKKIQAWRSRRKQRSLERWEQIRAKGKARFVVQSALTLSLTMVGATNVVDHLFGSDQYPISLSRIIWYLLIGIVTGSAGWDTMEGKYKNALIDARVKASPSGELPPHNNPLQITADSKSK
jgi:hypothetical protein